MEKELEIHYYYRTIRDLREDKKLNFDDPDGILDCLNPNVKNTFLANPSVLSDDDVCQIIALDGNKVIGSEMSFANRYIADGEVKTCRGASTLFVSEPYRKHMVGADIMIQAATMSPNQDNIVAGISQIAYPIYKAMRYGCFSFPRFIFLKKSRSAVETVLRTQASWTRLVSSLVDFCLWLYGKLLFLLTSPSGYTIEEVGKTPQEVEDIVLSDEHRFKELHNKEWFDWCLNNSFKEDNRVHLNIVKRKDEIVAFYVVKTEFYAQASSRGFKNVTLATISEWGINKTCQLTEPQLHVLAIKNLKESVDGVQIATTDEVIAKKYKRMLFFPMGIVNNAVYMTSTKEKSVKKPENWRLRIAAGDTMIN